jgi:signal transduction histidine kinase
LRHLIGTAILAMATIKKGSVGLAGATGAVLDRSLVGLRDLIDRTLVEVQLTAGIPARRERIVISDLISEVQAPAAIDAPLRQVALIVAPIEAGLAVDGDRDILAAATATIVNNALKFTRPRTRVAVRAFGRADRILLEVEDECGGLPAGKAEEMFRPFEPHGERPPRFTLGLATSRRGIEANGGKLYVRDVPRKGCVMTLDMPKPGPVSP